MLSDKDRELIGIGASIAAGCQPCTNFHLRAARIAGASEVEISLAVNDALSMRRDVTEVMARLAAQHVTVPGSDSPGSQEKTLIIELVSISAACAVNSITDFATHIAAAQALGATRGQILSTIKLARAVKDTTERKVEEATKRAMDMTSDNIEDCYHPKEEDVPEESAGVEARSEIEDCGPQCGCHTKVKNKNN